MTTPNDNWLYEHEQNNKVRYILGTKGEKPLICIGINPSTAEPNNLDNTLKSVVRHASSNSFDSWIMFNVYPQRATNPNDMHKRLNNKIHEANLQSFENILKGLKNPTIWAAWGTLINKRPYLPKCLKDIYDCSLKYNCNWVSIGNISKHGHPHHPLYLRSDCKTEVFDIDGYCKFHV
jgi:hypothetical protein